MAYRSGLTYYPGPVQGRKMDYSVEAIQRLFPLKSVRKFGQVSWDERFYYVEGERVRAFLDAGKWVMGTWTMADNSQWASMSDDEWARLTKHYIANIPKGGMGFEIGNEPGRAMADDFLRKLKIAADLFHEDGRRVIMGAPYPGAERAVWEKARDQGAFAYVDAIGLHPYANTPAASLNKVELARVMLDSFGCHKPLYLTEVGWATKGTMPTGKPHPFVVTEEVQAGYLTSAFSNFKANAERLKIQVALWYALNDWPPSPSSPNWVYWCGALRPDGSQKPSFAALQAV